MTLNSYADSVLTCCSNSNTRNKQNLLDKASHLEERSILLECNVVITGGYQYTSKL